MFWKKVVLPSSGMKSKPSKKTNKQQEASTVTLRFLLPVWLNFDLEMEAVCFSEMSVNFYETRA
jgi:hypothetical protein